LRAQTIFFPARKSGFSARAEILVPERQTAMFRQMSLRKDILLTVENLVVQRELSLRQDD
jgi:hypothetical protein